MRGYNCNYEKVVNAVVTLQMSVNDWQANAAVRDAFIDAVAKSAKTTKDRVQIVSVVARQGGGGAARRLLSEERSDPGETHVTLEIFEGLGRGLDMELNSHLIDVGLAASTGVIWIEPHSVKVSPADAR
jgi:hypothetical protein